MTSQRRIQSSRLNGARSRGPVTPEGKAASSQNGIRHGILANTVVLEGESKDRFEELLAELTNELKPQTATEAVLVQTMAAARWRQMRIWGIQKSGFDLEMARPERAAHSKPIRAAIVFRDLADNSRVLDLLQRYETGFDRQFCRALSLFMKLRTARNQELNAQAANGLPAAGEKISSSETPERAGTLPQTDGNSNLRGEPSPNFEHSDNVQRMRPADPTADSATALSSPSIRSSQPPISQDEIPSSPACPGGVERRRVPPRFTLPRPVGLTERLQQRLPLPA